MECPLCHEDLTGHAWDHWNMTGDEVFEVKCPTCGLMIIIRMEIEGSV